MKRPTTLKDVAVALGMHKSTVSLALSGKGTISAETRLRVRRVAQELGYAPNALAQRLAKGVEVATVYVISGALDRGLAIEKILLIQQALSACGLENPLYTSHAHSVTGEIARRQGEQVRNLWRQRPSAIICATQRLAPSVFDELANYHRQGGIVVSYDTAVPYTWDQVIFDREENAYRAARILLEAGHRKIGLGLSQIPDSTNPTDTQTPRVKGFQKALTEFGIPVREDWIIQTATYEQGGAELAAQFFAMSERPTAFAIVNDFIALAFMTELTRAGIRIPDDLSIVGHDNQPIASYCPSPLTTLTQPAEKIAEAVVSLTVSRLEGSSSPQQIITIESLPVHRSSVSPPSSA
jgi:LacI family transcriptional regulator